MRELTGLLCYKVGQAILPAAAFQAASSGALGKRRQKAGGSQDWLPHLVIVAGLVSFGPAIAASNETFKARLSTVAMDLSMRADIAGTGSVTALLAGNKLSITGSFEGLSTPATVARIHVGRVTGVRGPAVFNLTVSAATSGKVGGEVDLTAEQVDSLKKGRFYVQIGSEKAPDGNLWGWLLH
jgi:hypothetical protein